MDNLVSGEQILSKLLIDYEVKGDKLIAVCPLHDDTDPSFHMDRDTTQYYCFGCGGKGNWITLVRELTGQDPFKYMDIDSIDKSDYFFNSSLMKYKQQINKKLKYKTNDVDLQVIGKIHNPYDIPIAKEYCLKRNISLSDIDTYEMFYIDDAGYIGLSDYSYRLIIPIKNESGDIVSYEGRDVTGKADKKCIYPFRSKTGSAIFDIDKLDPNKPVVLVEGILDLIAFKRVFPNMQVTTYFGIQYTGIQADFIKRFDVISMFDSDDGGYRGYYELEKLGSFKVVWLSREGSDPSSATDEELKLAMDNIVAWHEFKNLLEGNLLPDITEW